MSEDLERLQRRLERERKARAMAESIAERVTAQLYETVGELRNVNDEVRSMNQSMRDFVAIASHDLRGPITAIIGFANLLDDAWDQLTEEKKRDFIRVVARQGVHLNVLVEDLLTISAIDAGALDTHRELVQLNETLQTAIADFSQRAADVRLSIAGDYAVIANPEHVRRIVVNYLENALKYGSEPIEIVVAEHDGQVEIRVCDGGEGVPEEFVERLFSKFARADTEATRGKKGTGLGLSIVRGLAIANGGDAWYEPNEPHGSRFCVRLPKPATTPWRRVPCAACRPTRAVPSRGR